MAEELTDTELMQLRKAIRHSDEALGPFRDFRRKAVRECVGKNYPGGTKKKVRANMLNLAIKTYKRRLVARNPQVLVTTSYREQRPSARRKQVALNYLIKRMNLASTLQKAVVDGLFCLGVIKVGLNDSGTVDLGGYSHHVGQSFAAVVDLDDYTCDMCAKDWSSIRWEANRYRVPYNEVMAATWLYDKKALKDLKPTPRSQTTSQGTEKVASFSAGPTLQEGEIEPYVELRDVWFPSRRLFITMGAEDEGPVLRQNVDWQGPQRGPYHKLHFQDVPANLMPLSLISDLFDLHSPINETLNKLIDEVQSQKKILGVPAPSDADARRIADTADGYACRIDSPEGAKELHLGGLDQASFAFFLQMKQLFDMLAGNLTTTAGLGVLADTARQEELLNRNSSLMFDDMDDTVAAFVTGIVEDLAFYEDTNPLMQPPLFESVPYVEGLDISLGRSSPEERGDYLAYNYNISPFSMAHQTPRHKLAFIQQVFESMIAPLIPMMQAQGIGVNLEELFRIVADYGNVEELQYILEYADQGMQGEPGGGSQEGGSRPAVTRRENVRISRSEMTPQGQDAALMQRLLGKSPQPAEEARIYQ